MDMIYLGLGFLLLVIVLPRVYSALFGLKEGEPAPLSTPAIRRAVKDSPVVLVYFYTSNCPACKMMTPVMARIRRTTGVPLIKINARKDPAAARDYKVMGVPATFIIRDGRIAERIIGAKSEKEVRSRL
jgi:thiol-disulfide isomerase/thioredoxin